MFRLSVAQKLFIIIVSTTTLVTLAGFTFLHIVQNMQLQTPNHPLKEWQHTELIQPLQKNNQTTDIVTDFSSLSPYCETDVVYQVTDQTQDYGLVIVRHLMITDMQGYPIWQCQNQAEQSNQFMLLPIKSRDDLADALSDRYNVGVEHLGGTRYLVVKPVKNNSGAVIGSLISEQEWSLQSLENKWAYALGIFFKNLVGFALINLLWILPSAVILVWLLTRGINRQLKHVLFIIEQWSGGNLNARIATSGDDQVAQSLCRLNQLAQDFQNTLKETRLLAETKERQRIAAELHDTVKQLLFANNLHLAACQQAELSDAAKDMIANAIDNNRKAFNQMNQLIDTLKPLDFIGEGFWPAIKDYIAKWSENQKIKVSMSLQEIQLNAEQSHVLYRALQESLQNVKKHTKADKVDIAFVESEGLCELIVRDNDNTSISDINFGQGLNLMTQRVVAIDGKLRFSKNQGGELILRFPANFNEDTSDD